MRRIVCLTIVLAAALAGAGAASAQTVGGLTPSALAAAIEHAAASGETRAVDPQAGSRTWGGDLERFLDQHSGVAWNKRGAAFQMGYQQRDFAPQSPTYDRRGYEQMLQDAPDMMGLSIKLHTR